MNEAPLGITNQEPIPLTDLMPAPEDAPKVVPEASMRNRAATVALLADPKKTVENYQTMVAEGQSGSDLTVKSLEQGVANKAGAVDMQHMIDMLGDKRIDLETKKNLVRGYAQNKYLTDMGAILRSQALAAPSKNESVDAERARITTADALREMQNENEKQQAIINGFAASRDSSTGHALVDIVATALIPFGTNIITGRVANNLEGKEGKDSLWNLIKAGALTGEQQKKMKEQFTNMPPEKRTAYIKNLTQALSESGGILFPGSNHYAQVELLRNITEDGRYDNTDRFLDDASTLLDIIGLRSTIKGLRNAGKGIKEANVAAKGLPSKADIAARPGTAVTPYVEKAEWELVDDTAKAPKTTGTDVVPHAYDVTPKPKQIGGPRALPAPSRAQEILDVVDTAERVEKNAHVATVNPVTPLAVFNQTNPSSARGVIASIVAGDDEVAKAMSGLTKDEALASQVLPVVSTPSGKVAPKVVDPFRDAPIINPPDPKLKEAANAGGATHFTTDEVNRAALKVQGDFTNAAGLTLHDGMGGFKLSKDGTKFDIDAVYGTSEGAFSNARQAVEQAKVALRSYGVLDSEIEILAKQGADYKPVLLKDVGEKEGNYLIRIKTSQDFDFNSIGKFDVLDVKRNALDRFSALIPHSGASAARYAMDPASMLHPVYTNSIGAAVDRANYIDKLFIELTTSFSDIVTKLPKDRRVKIDDYLKMANDQSIPFNRADLVGRGFNDKEIEAISNWKNVWDNHYYFENDDLVKTLNREGFQKYVGPNGTELFARPVPKGTDIGKLAIGLNKTVGRVFDPVANNAVFVSKAETEMLYAAGGTYAQLRRPTVINGEKVSHIIVRNTPNEYLRKFRDTDQVLNYKPMHYTRSYKAAKFVDEIGEDGARRAIAVGPDTPSAKSFAERMAANNPDKQYVVRDDARGMMRGTDDWFDIESASGRIAQRHRGDILGTTDGTKILGEGSFVVDPANSAIKAAQSLSGRIAMRPVIETAKERAIQQYGRLFPTDGHGKPRFPSELSEIGAKGEFTSKELADARTVVGHIQYIEHGYGNSIDDTFKQVFNAIANELGERGFGTAERASRAVGEINPSQKVKGAVFQSYIVMSNFVRQWIIQSNNAVRTLFLNPQHIMSGGLAKDIARYIADQGSVTKSDFTKFVDESGMIAGLDKSNLVRGSLSAMSEQRNALLHYGHKAFVQLPRNVGFDVGEGLNLISYMSSVYDGMKREGFNMLDKTNREIAYGRIRALTGEMNRAGDMPYNSGMMSSITQFLQVPHKSYLMYTNRKLDGGTKLRMLAGDVMLWGSAGGIIGSIFASDVLPDDPDSRYLVTEGVQAYLYNKMFKEVSGETQDLDLSALNPYGLDGWAKMYFALKEGKGLGDVAAAAPAWGLMNPESGRIPVAIKEMSQYFSGNVDTGLPAATLATVADRVAKIASGYSSYAVANAALESGKWKTATGDELPGEVTYPLAVAKALGFDRLSTRELYKLSQERFRTEKEFKDMVLKDYKETYRILSAAMNKSKTERDLDIAATNVFLKKWMENPAAIKIIVDQQKKDFMSKDDQMLRSIMRNAGIKDVEATRDQIRRAPIDEHSKDILLNRFENDILNKE